MTVKKTPCGTQFLPHLQKWGTPCSRLVECPVCGHMHMQRVLFKAENHRITNELLAQVENLLARGYNKQVAELTNLGQGTVKEIDKERLKRLYTENGKLKRPSKTTKYIAIDEFKLHDGNKYATHIIDLENGHVICIQEGKKNAICKIMSQI